MHVQGTRRTTTGRWVGGLAIPLALAAASTLADAPARPAVDRYVESERRSQGIPGISVAVVRHGRPFYVRGFGVATLEHPVRVTPDTLFQIGSIGKQFTATAVMLLVRDHRLELDDPVAKYLPEVPATWRGVTLRRMLNHQSGIAQIAPPDRDLLDLHHDYTDDEYVRLAASVPLDFEPGTDASYSDTAYVLLGIVINRVTGRFYGDLLAERVFGPLGMSRTRIVSDADIVRDRASGYERTASGALRNQSWVAPALNRTADGSLYSTVLDLARWDAALSKGRILEPGEIAQMWAVERHTDGARPLYHYGFGWEINSLRGHRVVEYDGNWQGFQAAMARYDDRGLTVIVLTNLSLCRAQRIAHTVAGYFDPAVGHYGRARRDSAPGLTADFRQFLSNPADEDAVSDRIAAGASARSTSWRRALARELREVGPVAGVALSEERHASSGWERVYRVEAKSIVDFFVVRYGTDRRIDDVDLYREY